MPLVVTPHPVVNWDFAQNRADLQQAVLDAFTRCGLFRIVIFVGETHTSDLDIERTREIAGFCTDVVMTNRLIVVAEREILGKPGEAASALLALRPNVINETAAYSPFDPRRDLEIVQKIVAEMERDVGGGLFSTPRPVVILFGQDHEEKIKTEFRRQRPLLDLRWWSFPSMQEQFDSVPDNSDNNVHGFHFLGFFNPVEFARLDRPIQDFVRITLFTKGHYTGPITVPITAKFATPFNGTLRVVYGRSTVARFAAVPDNLDATGTTNLQIDQDVKLIPLATRAQYNTL
jgi:hypothetical protein